MTTPQFPSKAMQRRALFLSTFAMMVCFMVWVIFSIIGVQLKTDLGLSGSEFGMLVATPILTGAISRPFLGIWAELHGGHRVYTVLMLLVAGFTFLLAQVDTYPMLLLTGLGIGLAGGSFAIGTTYVSAWYEQKKQGTALGIFGMGNVGTAITGLVAPQIMNATGHWQSVAYVFAALALLTAVILWLFAKPDPKLLANRDKGSIPTLAERIEPLKKLQVWRFSCYYFLSFGGFVALSSWLPNFYMGVYHITLAEAGVLVASFGIPAGAMRAVGGMLADRFGPRRIMYISFLLSIFCLLLMSYPNTHYVVEGVHGPIAFTIAPSLLERALVLILLGFAFSLGEGAVYKHIPAYYPDHVGAVGGVVGMVGALGGFFMPILFGVANDVIGIWSSCFMLLFGVAVVNLLWMHFTILHKNRQIHPDLKTHRELPELMQ